MCPGEHADPRSPDEGKARIVGVSGAVGITPHQERVEVDRIAFER